MPGVRGVLRVATLSDRGLPREDILDGLAVIAKKHDSGIAVEIPTTAGRIAYGAGGVVDDWASNGFVGLPWTDPVEIKSLADLPHEDYRQVFELFGNSAFRDDVQRFLKDSGIASEPMVGDTWFYLFGGTALGDLAQLTAVFCIVMSVVGTVLNARTEAVRSLHGYGFMSSFAHGLRQALGPILIPLIVLSAVMHGGLLIHSGWPSVFQMLRFEAVLIVSGLILIVASILGTMWMIRRISTVNLLVGKLPTWSSVATVYGIRLLTCLAVASMSIATINHAEEWNKQRAEEEGWSKIGSAYTVSLSGARSMEDTQETSTVLAQRVRDLSNMGKTVYASYLYNGIARYSNMDRDSMILNEFAAPHSLSGPVAESWKKYRQSSARGKNSLNKSVVFIPDSIPRDADWRQGLAGGIGEDPDVITYSVEQGHSRVFTWESGFDEWMNRAYAVDPVVLVLPNDLSEVSDRNVVAAISQRDLMFTDYGDYDRLLSDPEVGSFLRNAEPQAQQWFAHHAAMGRNVWTYLGALIAACIMVVAVSITAWSTLSKIFHQRLRASHIHGILPRRLIGAALLGELLIVGCVFYFLWYRGAQERLWTGNGEFAGAADPSLVAIFHVPSLSWWLAIAAVIISSVPVAAVLTWRRSQKHLIQGTR